MGCDGEMEEKKGTHVVDDMIEICKENYLKYTVSKSICI